MFGQNLWPHCSVMGEEIDRKTLITKLYENEAEGTKYLYADIGYLMRMEMWDDIEIEKWLELSEDCKQNFRGNEEEARNYFDNIIRLMNIKIKSMGHQSRGQMLFNRNFIQERFSGDPVQFVHVMAENFEKENQLISHYKTPIESQNMNNDKIPCHFNDDVNIAESERNLLDLRCRLEQLDPYTSANSGFDIGTPIHSRNLAPPNFVQAAIDSLVKLIGSLQVSEKNVLELIANAVQADAYQSISLTPRHPVSYDQLSSVCDRYASILNEVFHHLHLADYRMILSSDLKFFEIEEVLKQLILKFMKRNMIFTKHPEEVILVTKKDKYVEQEVKTEQAQANTSSKGKGQKNAQKENVKVYDTKKKKSIDAKVSILGLKEFKDAAIVSHSLTLATEQQLASPETSGNGSPSQGSCGTLHPTPKLPQSGEIELNNLKIEGYERASDSVYEQMVRLQYIVKIQAFGEMYQLKAFSLPFFLCTGAIQVLELLGSRMWYLANKTDLFHGDFQVISALHVDDVVNMLENRIKSTCLSKRRGLSFDGKTFLRERIPEIDSQGKVTLHTFIKDKMKVAPDDRQSDTVECYKFTFFAWFYAFTKSIEKNFMNLWHDGIIYDLFSFRDSCEFLLKDSVSSGCVLLRPGLSKVYKPNSPDAQIRLIADIKVRCGGQWKVFTIPINPETLENCTLFDIVSNISAENVKPRSIYTRKGILTLSVLKEFNVGKGKKSICYHGFKVENGSSSTVKSEGIDNPPTEEDLDPNRTRRKTARNDSTSSYQEQIPSVSSIESLSADPYDRRSTDTDFTLNADAVSPVSPASSTSPYERQNRSPLDDFTAAVKQELANNNWQHFGGNIKVDVSHLSTMPNNSPNVLSFVPHGEHEQTLASLAPNEAMDYECPHHHHQQISSQQQISQALTGIPTTVQDINEDTRQDESGIKSFHMNVIDQPLIPGWTERDIFDAIQDQQVTLV